ncbi:MAG: hypothetical protein V1876_00230, partial [Candidatus Peregrinibacteria bacterium]
MGQKRLVVLTILSVSVGAAFVGTLWNREGASIRGQVLPNDSIVIDDDCYADPAEAPGRDTVCDDTDPAFTTTGNEWQYAVNDEGYLQDFSARNALPNQSYSANWTFTDLAPGRYKVFVTYKAYRMLANAAPYIIKEVDTAGVARELGTATVKQQDDPT